jgi:hypothetical protein
MEGFRKMDSHMLTAEMKAQTAEIASNSVTL